MIETLANKLKAVRTEKQLTRRELGKSARVSPNTIYNIERGRYYPRELTLKKLAKALGVKVEELAEDNNEMMSEKLTLDQNITYQTAAVVEVAAITTDVGCSYQFNIQEDKPFSKERQQEIKKAIQEAL